MFLHSLRKPALMVDTAIPFIFNNMKKEKGDFDASRTFLYEHCLKEWWPALDASRSIFACGAKAARAASGPNAMIV